MRLIPREWSDVAVPRPTLPCRLKSWFAVVSRALLFAGAGDGAAGLVLASAATQVSGVLLVAAGALFVSAARAGVVSTYAAPQMPARTVRFGSAALAVVGCLFVLMGIIELASQHGIRLVPTRARGWRAGARGPGGALVRRSGSGWRIPHLPG